MIGVLSEFLQVIPVNCNSVWSVVCFSRYPFSSCRVFQGHGMSPSVVFVLRCTRFVAKAKPQNRPSKSARHFHLKLIILQNSYRESKDLSLLFYNRSSRMAILGVFAREIAFTITIAQCEYTFNKLAVSDFSYQYIYCPRQCFAPLEIEVTRLSISIKIKRK